MGHAHAHAASQVSVGRLPRVVLLTFLTVVAVATVVGVWRWWPDHHVHIPASAAYAAPGVTFPHATVVAVEPRCPTQQSAAGCGHVRVRLGGSDSQTLTVEAPPEIYGSGLRAGDSVQLARTPGANGQPATYTFFQPDRHLPLLWMALAFAVVVIAVARIRGLLALFALGFSALVLSKFLLPALLDGESAIAVALVGSSAIMFVVLYLTHGPSLRTSTALAGTLVGTAVTAGLGAYAVHSSRLTGISDESGGILGSFVNHLSFPGLLTAGLIVAGLGVLNDVTITQASAVWELRSAAPDLGRRQIFTSAMRIGRDHIASTIYTIAFAYAGASIVVLLLLAIYDRPFLDLVSNEAIAEEIVRTLGSGIGLVLAVPITTAIAAAVASPSAPAGRRRATRSATQPGM
jgi:uncharacterized membrane protein